MLRQLCNDGGDFVLIENNGVTQKWAETSFWSNYISFNEDSIASVTTQLSQR